MRLLVVTQTVDDSDSTLGFFCRWLSEFSKHFETLTVICLKRGPASLTDNMTVHSLGKERRPGRLRYPIKFYRYLWRERGNYDAVFVHMNLEYVLLAGVYWRLKRIPVFLWYNHRAGGLLLWIASLLARRVLYTSSFAAPRRFKNSVEMPAGIDTSLFTRKAVPVKPSSLLFLGRVAPIKAPDTLIRAALLLDRAGISLTLDVVGNPSPLDGSYYEKLQELGKPLEEKGKLTFLKGVAHAATPEIYSSHELSINLSPSGLFDKTVLEAMACETLVLVSSPAFVNLLPDDCRFREGDTQDLAQKIERLLHRPQERKNALRKELREQTVAHHSLSSLARTLAELYSRSV